MKVERWAANVDYIRCTLPVDARERDRFLWMTACEGWAKAFGEANEARRRYLLGYEGREVGPFFFGEGHEGLMFQCSSAYADSIVGACTLPGVKCTRIDYALTVWLNSYHESLAQEGERDALLKRSTDRLPTPRKVILYKGNGAGDTLYLGSRQSDEYGRLYDKDRESGKVEYAYAWRYETEYKGRAAQGAYSHVVGRRDRAGRILSSVVNWWSSRGVPCPVGAGDGDAVSIAAFDRTSDVDRTRLWLCSQVAPAIKRLLATTPRDQILADLGLLDQPRMFTEL